jgi:hypothetical protein
MEDILQDSNLENNKERYLKILKEQGEEGDYIDSLYFLCECLKIYHEKKVIILIDEYDVPLENAFFEGFYDRMIAFIRSLFESALKTNPFLEFAVITRCLRISADTVQKELNKLLKETISFNDAYENFYHGFVVGVLANMHEHIVKSNREGGSERPDIYIKSLSIFEPAVIIELKVCDNPKEIF